MSEFVEVKTADLDGAALDWAVASAYGKAVKLAAPAYGNGWRVQKTWYPEEKYSPSADWSQGGALIEKYMVSLHCPQSTDDVWAGWVITDNREFCQAGDTALIAACRAIVASVLGDTVQVPKELCQ